MSVARTLSFFTALCVVGWVVLGCSQGAPEGAAQGKSTVGLKQPEDLSQRALEILNQKCIVCHTAERFEKAQFTSEQWSEVIDRMVAKGAKLSGDEMDVLRHWRDTK
jgi:ADP-heptose:LPS heptosyltransferase